MNPISGVINNQKDPIANRIKNQEIKPNRLLDSTVVDKLLVQYQDLIDRNYIHWFAARFYTTPFDKIHAAASEARHATNPQRLFAFLIKKYS